MEKSKHIGFNGLEHKIEHSEEQAHPNYSKEHIRYIANAAAGQVARKRREEGRPLGGR